MSIRVNLPDGRIVNFPDGMPPQEIEKALADLSGAQPSEPAPERKSVGGFLGNAVSSTGKLLKDSATGLYEIAKLAADVMPNAPIDRQIARHQQVGETIQNAPQIVKAAGQGIKNRYGSLDAIGNSLYSDPAGVAADLSAVLSLGSTAAARAPRLASALGKAASATNPLQVMKPIAKAAEYGTAAAIRPMLGPPTALVRQSRAPLEIERTALRTGAVTKGSAGRKLGRAMERTNQAADEATKAGTTIGRGTIAQFPKTLKDVENVTPNVRELDELAALETDTLSSLPKKMTPSQLLEKRRGQDAAVNTAYRAEEKGGYIRSTADKGKKEIADNMRAEFRAAVPAAAESDDLARRLALVRGSLENANTRPKGIPMSGALLGMGGGAALGGPAGAGMGAAFGIGRTFPQIPLALGSGPVMATAAAAHPVSQQALLLAALLERLSGGDQ